MLWGRTHQKSRPTMEPHEAPTHRCGLPLNHHMSSQPVQQMCTFPPCSCRPCVTVVWYFPGVKVHLSVSVLKLCKTLPFVLRSPLAGFGCGPQSGDGCRESDVDILVAYSIMLQYARTCLPHALCYGVTVCAVWFGVWRMAYGIL